MNNDSTILAKKEKYSRLLTTIYCDKPLVDDLSCCWEDDCAGHNPESITRLELSNLTGRVHHQALWGRWFQFGGLGPAISTLRQTNSGRILCTSQTQLILQVSWKWLNIGSDLLGIDWRTLVLLLGWCTFVYWNGGLDGRSSCLLPVHPSNWIKEVTILFSFSCNKQLDSLWVISIMFVASSSITRIKSHAN